MTGERLWIGTSWKMNKTIAEARAYVAALVPQLPLPGVQAFVLPPHTALAAVRDQLGPDSPLLLGAQNAHWAAEGPGTGEVSMRMVKDAGARLVEIGHSERRRDFGETDETVARKARASLDHGLIPLICVGEPAPVRAAGREQEFVLSQVLAALRRVSPTDVSRVMFAYEPVWAIGSGGRPATPDQVAPVMGAIAAQLDASSRGCRGTLLYGGGVDAGNAAELLQTPNVDGLFVGRAAWSPDGLVELLQVGSVHAAGTK